MKNIFKFALVACVGLVLSSCLKDLEFDENKVGLNEDNISTKSIIEIVGGGISNFRNHVLSVDLSKARDTSRFTVSYTQGGLTAPEDITVTFAYDATAFSTYNADTVFNSNRIRFEKLPDSTFSFPITSVTIKKGQKLSEAVNFIVFPGKIDPAKVYLFPITITSTSSSNSIISGNRATIYFHIIGNPLGGTYTVVGTRWNATAVGDQAYSGGPIPSNFTAATIPGTKILSVVGPSTTTTYIANLGAGTARDYFFTINPSATTIQDIDISLTPSFASGVSNIRWLQKDYNPATKTITLRWTYNNQLGGAGNDRIILETMTKQ